MTRVSSVAALLCACGPTVVPDVGGGMGTDGGEATQTQSGWGPDADASTSTDDGEVPPCGQAGGPGPRCSVDLPPLSDDTELDVLVVIDNSVSMADEQPNVSRNLLGIVRSLRELTDSVGNPIDYDVHLMVTTTDFGNPLCPATPGYAPARGGPVTQGCNARIAEFTDPSGTRSVEEACTAVCPVDVVSGSSYVSFGPRGTNAQPVAPVDVDGDGVLEDAAAQAVACLGAQGIIGCEYEAPLEAMLQALHPAAAWNSGADPFLRDDAMLWVVIVTDEPDCSASDLSFVLDEAYMNVDPATLVRGPSSASCWNAGTICSGPDADGVYATCTSADGPLHDIERYASYLESAFEDRVVLGLVAGVPSVTRHNENAPYEPVAGGVFDLVYRDWREGAFPEGDILPADDAVGVTAVDQQFRFGIGPGCTSETSQGTPPVRLRELCDTLAGDAPRCAIESICDDDFSAITRLLTREVGQTLPPG